jgi:hypothetical protein
VDEGSKTMSRTLEKRVERLEIEVARRKTVRPHFTQILIMDSIAHYLGDPQPDEDLLAADARALGYKDPDELRNALEGNPQEYHEKYRRAARTLFAKFGVDLDGNREGFEDALKRMNAGLPVWDKVDWAKIASTNIQPGLGGAREESDKPSLR